MAMPLTKAEVKEWGEGGGGEFELSKEYPRRSFQLAVEDVCLAFRKCVIAGDRLGNHPSLNKWSEKIRRPKEKSEGKIQDEKIIQTRR